MRTLKKRLIIWLGIPAVLIVVLLAVVWAFLGTAGGRTWLVEKLLDRVNQTALSVELKGLQTPSLGQWHWASLTVSSDQQQLLYIEDLSLRFTPAALLSRQLKIDSLTASRIEWYALPEPSPTPEAETDKPLNIALPDSPLRVTVDHLQADFIQLPPGYAGNLSLPNQWRLSGSADLFAENTAPSLNLQLSSLTGTETELTISSRLHTDGSMHIAGNLSEEPGGALGSLVKQPSGMDANFALSIETRDEEVVVVGIEQLQTQLGEHPLKVRGTLRLLSEKNELHVPELIIATGENQHKFQGAYTADDAWLESRLRDFPLDLLTPWIPELTDGRISGDLHLNWQHSNSKSWPSGSADIRGSATYQQIQFSTLIEGDLKNKTLHLNPSELRLDDTQLQVRGRLDWEGDNSQLEVSLTDASTDLIDRLQVKVPAQLASLTATIPKAELKLSGNWRDPFVFISTQAKGMYQEQAFRLELEANGNQCQADINALVLETGGGRLDAQGMLDWTGSQTALSVQLVDLNDSLIQLAPQEYVASLQDLSFNVNGNAQINGPLTRPEVQSDLTVEGEYAGRGEPLPYSLVSKGSIRVGKPSDLRINVQDFHVALFGNEVISVQGNYQRETLDLTIDVSRLPARTLSLFGWNNITGEAQAHLQLSGNFDNPIINGHATYLDNILIYGKKNRRLPAQITVNLETTEGILQVRNIYEMDGEQVGDLSLELPIKPYLEPDRKNLPLDFNVQGKLDLAMSRWLLNPDLHDLRGDLVADLRVQGTATAPRMNGEVTLHNGYYEHMVSRTQWENLQANIDAQGTTLQIREVSARSGDNGSIRLSGSVEWGKSQRQDQNAIDLAIQANNAIVIRQRNLYAEIDGDVSIEGNFQELWVKGEASVSPLDANIDAAIQSNIPSITVTEVKRSDDANKPSVLPVAHLNLTIYAEQQAFIRGRGLEAELEGEFRVQGTASDPSYTGVLRTRQGRMDLFGKRFVLQTGEVRISNQVVSLRIPAVYTSDDLEVNAELYGTSDEPKLRLSSVPPLPEDEILSRLIFGKSVQQVTPFQAVRLAAAANSLRSGGGFDPMDSARQLLGVDTLNIENESTENGSGVSIGVGKYINERVYLQLERSPNPAQPWQGSIQIELTPKLRLESGTSEEGGAGAKLLWKKDY